MVFPQGGDFSRSVDRALNIVASDPTRDQGTTKLTSKDEITSSYIEALVSLNVTGSYIPYAVSQFKTGIHYIYKFDTEVEGASFLYARLNSLTSSVFEQVVTSSVFSFWRMPQFNPGFYPRLPGYYSDVFAYDIIDSFTFVGSRTFFFIETPTTKFKLADTFTFNRNLVSTDYYTTISGETDICLGDEEPPFITYVEPSISGAHVRPRSQTVEFLLTDEVGGVDLSSVSIRLTSGTTSGTISLVESGNDQTGGDVTIIGDPSSYRFRYIPPFLWDTNDVVIVAISGTDLPPTVDGDPFYCGAVGVNTFIGDIPFQVAETYDLGATLTVIGDVSPPYISAASPSSSSSDNDVFTNVSLSIADDLTGVDLSSIYVSIDGKSIIEAGTVVTEEAVITGTPSEYTITYNPVTAFTYGSTASVSVVAADRVQVGLPNVLSANYSFSFISSGTLVIENFQPAIGTHHNLENVDIKVDIRDDTYNIDTNQTFFVINGTIVSGTQTPLASGVQLTYHPENDFAFDEPIRITVHGTNANSSAPVVKESFYNLFYGCRIYYFNEQPFVHAENVDVFVRARNNEEFYKDLSTGYYFTAYTQPQNDLGASIVATNPMADLPTTISGLGPEHRYGETVTVEFSAEDFDGRILTHSFTYTIENRPE